MKLIKVLNIAIQEVIQTQKEGIFISIFIWILAIILCALYFAHVPFITYFFDNFLISIKTFLGPTWFAFLFSGIFCGIIPSFLSGISKNSGISKISKISKNSGKIKHIIDAIFLFCIFGLTGISCYYMYYIFSIWFGDTNNFLVILQKVLLDQFIYMPFFSMPIFTNCFYLQEINYDISEYCQNIRQIFFHRWLVMVMNGWLTWIPLEICVYLFPVNLQLPIMNIFAVMFYTIILVFDKKNEQVSLENNRVEIRIINENVENSL